MKLVLFTSLLLVLVVTQNPVWVVSAFVLINAFQWGLNNVGYSVEAVRESKFKATLLSVKSQIQSLIAAAVALSMGYFIETLSYQKAYLILTIVFVGILLPMLFYIYRDVKSRGGFGDGADDGGE